MCIHIALLCLALLWLHFLMGVCASLSHIFQGCFNASATVAIQIRTTSMENRTQGYIYLAKNKAPIDIALIITAPVTMKKPQRIWVKLTFNKTHHEGLKRVHVSYE